MLLVPFFWFAQSLQFFIWFLLLMPFICSLNLTNLLSNLCGTCNYCSPDFPYGNPIVVANAIYLFTQHRQFVIKLLLLTPFTCSPNLGNLLCDCCCRKPFTCSPNLPNLLSHNNCHLLLLQSQMVARRPPLPSQHETRHCPVNTRHMELGHKRLA